MKGKDLKEGSIFGTKRVRKIVSRGRFILFTYDYLVSDGDDVRWYRQAIPPVDAVHCNKVLPEPSTSAP
jgi:hypothetical protein